MKIKSTHLDFVREPLKSPFGFKGRYLTELWQVVSGVRSERAVASGVGVQSVLWSDAEIFASRPESEGNAQMFLMTAFALKLMRDREFDTPLDALDALLPPVSKYGEAICGKALRKTFALNSLVSVDNALWRLYARERGADTLEALVPEPFKAALNCRHDKLCAVPLLSYGVKETEIREIFERGTPLVKIKIGFDPTERGDKGAMLDWDRERLNQIHRIAEEYRTPYTESGRIGYYIDANGMYDTRERLSTFLEHADKIGALPDILLFEEPFDERAEISLDGLKARFAADESVHDVADVRARADMGYSAFALKPIAKTLSKTLECLAQAHALGIPCFCADLTVNPAMVDINKNIAGRIGLIPGMKIGVVESNGAQNYQRWEELLSAAPGAGKVWSQPEAGIFTLNDEFYRTSGMIFRPAPYYDRIAAIE